MKVYSRLAARMGAVLLLAGVLVLGSTATSEAAFIAYICNDVACDGVGDIITPDGDGDGFINTGGAVGGFEVTVNLAQSKPLIDGMDLNFTATNSGGGNPGTIWFYAVDTDFSGPANIFGTIGGTQNAGGTVTAYICGGDSNGGLVPVNTPGCSSTGALVGTPFGGAVNHFASADPYSLTLGVVVSATCSQCTTTGDFGVTGVPEPASIAMFGLGLFGVGLASRRRLLKK